MPELKQIEASIELGTSNMKLKEYGARYSDGHVETFIAVPDTEMPFSIHLTTKGYIAPGISCFVFMDGEYQCNRNKIGLKLPGDGVAAREYETEFRLRQKEEKTSAGSFVAREWSFAKLNTVAADKAPSLNSGFVRNVGTIEVVAMRCRPSSEELVQGQTAPETRKLDAAGPKASSRLSKVKSAKQPTPVPSKAPSNKAAAAEGEGFFGGMFGMFDGACDNMGLDGANDQRPVRFRFDGRVNPQPPPGFIWESTRSKSRPGDPFTHDMPGAFLEQGPDVEPDGRARAKAFVANAMQEAQNAQLDGPGDWRNTYCGGYAEQQRDDLRGDRYFGMTGQDRSEYKQFFRERGDAVSQTPRPVTGIGIMDGFVCNTRAAAEDVQKAPPHAKDTARFFAATQNKAYYENNTAGMRLLTGDLERVRRDLVDANEKNPRLNTSYAWRDWSLMEARLHDMGGGRRHEPSQLRHTPGVQVARKQTTFHALEEALEDVQILRTKLQIIGQSGAGLQVSDLLDRLQQAESHFMDESLWSGPPPINELSALNARREQLRRRNGLLSEIISAITKISPSYNVDSIAKRIDKVCEEGRHAGRRIAQLKGNPPASASLGAGGAEPTTPGHVNFEQGYDGAPWQQADNPKTPTPASFWNNATGGNDDWQEMGERSWKQGQQTAWSAPKQTNTHEHFPNENLNKANSGRPEPAANDWTQGQQNGNAGVGSHVSSKRSERNGWGDSSQQQQQGGGWDGDRQNDSAWHASKPASNAASNADSGAQGSNQGGSAGWDAPGSQHRSQNDGGGGDDNWNNGGEGGADWGAQSNKSQSKGGRRGNDVPANNANGSRPGACSSRVSTASSPKELIKPYWENWNKPGGQRSGSQADSAKMREVAREAYAYSAARLPVIPEGKFASATHGIQTGRGAEYNHVCRRPVYIDTMEKPYAVFSFKYRSKDKLKKITGLNVKSVDDDVKAVQKQVKKDKLMQMPKDQLIEQLMVSSTSKRRSQKAASTSGGQGLGSKPGSKATSKADAWGNGSNTKSAAGSGWGLDQMNGGDGGWGGSNHSKSKKSSANGWGADRGGGGWDGQNDAAGDGPKTDTRANPASGSFKFDYDAFRNPDGAATPVNGPVGRGWEREVSSSIFEDPDGVRWNGAKVVGHASWANSEVRRSDPVEKKAGETWA